MSASEGLPGRWVDLHLGPSEEPGGLGPAVGWLAGALASGGTLWGWPALGWLLLGLFLTAAVWGRLWLLLGEPSPPLPQDGRAADSASRFLLPYTLPGSLSAAWGAALARGWRRLRALLAAPRSQVLEGAVLAALLLVVAGLRGWPSLVVVGAGLALLGLRRLVRGRPAALNLLRALGGVAWPWWWGHVAYAPLTGESLLLGLLWGLAYAGWAILAGRWAAGRPRQRRFHALLGTDLAQAAVVTYFILVGQPVIAGALTFTLLGQVLAQAGLARADRWDRVAGWTWPLAAAGMVLTGLALGGWG